MASKSIIDLEKCIDKEVRVKFQGGREVRGVLKGFDQLVNIVLDNCVESMHGASARARFFRVASGGGGAPGAPTALLPADPDDPYRLTDKTRKLGLVVCRGLQVRAPAPRARRRRAAPQVSLVSPVDMEDRTRSSSTEI
ncbi:hypothetical protein JL722_618 [Aureococcus anophagefferens]|nr:hypothetical protein JL722_618 [Aureococcus anophagefferens]